ncbi:hypothetical protein MPER_11092 [Moniliophthora perniciosa FA553]|nr:hypothetical protein MPER_11092 [Moniliophthora perniciosa FA553]
MKLLFFISYLALATPFVLAGDCPYVPNKETPACCGLVTVKTGKGSNTVKLRFLEDTVTESTRNVYLFTRNKEPWEIFMMNTCQPCSSWKVSELKHGDKIISLQCRASVIGE